MDILTKAGYSCRLTSSQIDACVQPGSLFIQQTSVSLFLLAVTSSNEFQVHD